MMLKNRRHSVNRPPTPDVLDDREKEPSLPEIINIKVLFFIFSNLCYNGSEEKKPL